MYKGFLHVNLALLCLLSAVCSAVGPPKRVGLYQARQIAKVGQAKKRFACPVEADPVPIVQWLKDGDTITEMWPRYRITKKEGALRIKDIELDDAGLFVCKATNGFGSINVNFSLIVVAVYKKLEALSKKQKCGIIHEWAKSISNHIYWCAMTSGGNGQLVVEKWTSIERHVTNIHEGHGDLFTRCSHSPINRNWIAKGSKAHKELKAVVCSTRLKNDIKQLSYGDQTAHLESYHKVVCYFAAKHGHFFFESMEARLLLACLHFNENVNKDQAVRKDGTRQWKVSYSKARKYSGIVTEVKTNVTYDKESGLVKQGGSVYEPGPDEDITKEGVKPKFIEQDKMERKSVIVRPVGSSLRLRCRANGNPLPAVRWMKDGHDTILISDEGSDADKKKWTLKLRDLQETDSGTYQCVVSNRHGVINFTYSVEVIGQMKTKPVLIGPHPLNETVTLGGYASFQCKVKSQVQPHIQWLKRLDKELEATVNSTNIIEVKGQKFVVLKTGEVYKDNEGFYVNKLVIKNVLGTDIGMYICLGANTMGYSFRSAFLTIVSDNSDTPMSNNPSLSINPGLSSDSHQRTQQSDSSSSSEEVGNGSLPLIIAIPACVAIVLVTLAIFILKKRKKCNNNSNARRNTRFNAVPTQERENFTPAVQYPHILPPKGPPNRSMDKASTKHSSDFYSDISSVSRCHHHPQQGHSNHQYGY